MSTKAERARSQAQRNANPPRPPSPAKPRRDRPVDTSEPGVSADDRKVGQGETSTRNASKKAARKGTVSLENSETGRPSRKSTRRSPGHVKQASQLQRRQVRATRSPKARAERAKAQKTSAGSKTPAPSAAS